MTFKNSLIYNAAILLILGILLSFVVMCSGFKLRTLLLFAIIFSMLIPISIRILKGKFDLFEPLVITNISFLFMFIGRPLANLVIGQNVSLGYNILNTFDEALFLAWIGILSFQFGYFSPLRHFLLNRLPYPPTFQPRTAVFSAWLFTGFGGALFWIFLCTQGGLEVVPYLIEGRQASNNEFFLESTGYLYNAILMWGPASLVFFAVAVVYRKLYLFIPFIITLLPLVILYGSRGTRSQLFPLVISLFVFWYLWQKRRPSIRAIFLIGLLGLVLSGWLREFRNVETKENAIKHLKAIASSPIATIGDLLTSPDTEMFDALAIELSVVPKTLAFMPGATFSDITIRAIPRPLYPNKPLESNDKLVNELWPEHYSLSRASPCFSLIGVLYADIGYITVVSGMYFFGTIFGAFWLWFNANSNNIMAQMIYSMGLPFVVILMRGSIPDTLARMLFYFAPLYILMIVKRLRKRKISNIMMAKN